MKMIRQWLTIAETAHKIYKRTQEPAAREIMYLAGQALIKNRYPYEEATPDGFKLELEGTLILIPKAEDEVQREKQKKAAKPSGMAVPADAPSEKENASDKPVEAISSQPSDVQDTPMISDGSAMSGDTDVSDTPITAPQETEAPEARPAAGSPKDAESVAASDVSDAPLEVSDTPLPESSRAFVDDSDETPLQPAHSETSAEHLVEAEIEQKTDRPDSEEARNADDFQHSALKENGQEAENRPVAQMNAGPLDDARKQQLKSRVLDAYMARVVRTHTRPTLSEIVAEIQSKVDPASAAYLAQLAKEMGEKAQSQEQAAPMPEPGTAKDKTVETNKEEVQEEEVKEEKEEKEQPEEKAEEEKDESAAVPYDTEKAYKSIYAIGGEAETSEAEAVQEVSLAAESEADAENEDHSDADDESGDYTTPLPTVGMDGFTMPISADAIALNLHNISVIDATGNTVGSFELFTAPLSMAEGSREMIAYLNDSAHGETKATIGDGKPLVFEALNMSFTVSCEVDGGKFTDSVALSDDLTSKGLKITDRVERHDGKGIGMLDDNHIRIFAMPLFINREQGRFNARFSYLIREEGEPDRTGDNLQNHVISFVFHHNHDQEDIFACRWYNDSFYMGVQPKEN